ncbi:MAG: hypothetical protein ACREU4_13145, partial [Burkholderiales bacterium]
GEEYVLRSQARDRFGDTFLSRLNAGILDLSALPSDVAAAMPRPYQPARESARFGGEGARAAAPVNNTNIHVGLLNLRGEMRRFMQEEGAKYAYDFTTRRTRQV